MLRFSIVTIFVTLVNLTNGGPLNIIEYAKETGSTLSINENQLTNISPSDSRKFVSINGADTESFPCGKAPRPSRVARIVGGVEARPNSHPWIVSLQQYGSHFCGGTLIRVGHEKEESDIVMTAAHCVYDGTGGVTVSAGVHQLNELETPKQEMAVKETAYHVAYDPKTRMNDIAILKLQEPIKYSSVVQPMCLPSKVDDFLAPGTIATTAGWGILSEGDYSASNELQQVNVSVVETSRCVEAYSKDNIKIDEKAIICVSYGKDGKAACSGDAGGLLFGIRDNQFTLYGIASFGMECAKSEYLGVYTRVANYLL